MHGFAIAAEALARDGLGLLTGDFGEVRLAGIVRALREPRSAEAKADGAGQIARAHGARATRP